MSGCDQRDGAVVGARITPALERVSIRNVPVTQVRGLVDVEPVVHRQRHLREAFRELQIGRGREHRVAAEDDQQFDRAGVHRGGQVDQRGMLILRRRFDRQPVGHRRADIAERLVHRMRHGMHRGRLILAGDDQRRAAMCLKILGYRGNPGRLLAGRATGVRHADRGRQCAREALDVRGPHRQPVIRLGPGQRRGALHRIEPVHGRLAFAHPAAIGEVAGVAHRARAAGQEVGVQREDDVGLVEVVDRLARTTCCLTRRSPRPVTRNGVVLMPLRLRIGLEQGRHQLSQRG